MRSWTFVLCLLFGQAAQLQMCGERKLAAAEPVITSQLVFPLNPQHNHAPGIVQFDNGELLVSWYRGSGERTADDVAVYGSRLPKDSQQWSEPFLMVDRPGFPDCNTCMFIDKRERLWLFWPTILANSWESCLTNAAVSSDYRSSGSPKWDRETLVLLKPADFSEQAEKQLDKFLGALPQPLSDRQKASIADT